MKQSFITILFSVIMSMVGAKALAYDIAVENADGVTIYYNFINNETEFEVTYITDSYVVSGYKGSYSGSLVIPEEVNYMNKTRKVTSISRWAFQRCIYLTSVTIPNSITSIGERAFEYCSSLNSITIPGSVTSIGDLAFNYCSGLTSITVEAGNTVYDSRDNCNGIIKTETNTLIAGCQNSKIPISVNNIAANAFTGCSSLTSVIIPNSVTSIESGAFYNCSGLTTIIIPTSVTIFGDHIFYGCISLTSVTIPSSVTSIGTTVFGKCKSLTSVTIPNSVTYIGVGAFLECSSLTSVSISDSVTSIGGMAFYGCSSLSSVTIPNSVTSIGDEAFSQCSGLSSVTIPNSVTYIGAGAFDYCSSLTSVAIPNSVKSIIGNVFGGCSNLTSIIVEAGNTEYDSRDNCNAIIITETNYLKAGCQNTIIPNGVTSIGSYAFLGCSGLTSITIPNSVTSIGSWAFYGCVSLADVFCTAETVPSTDIGAFDDSYPEYISLHVPASSIDAYTNIPPWCDFGNIVALTDEELDPSSIVLTNSDSSPYPINYFNLDGKRIPKPQRGLNIIKMSDGTTKKMFIK